MMENDHAYFEEGDLTREGFYSPSRVWLFRNGMPMLCNNRRVNYLGTFEFEESDPPGDNHSTYSTYSTYSTRERLLEPTGPSREELGWPAVSDDASSRYSQDSSTSSFDDPVDGRHVEQERVQLSLVYALVFEEAPLVVEEPPLPVFEEVPLGDAPPTDRKYNRSQVSRAVPGRPYHEQCRPYHEQDDGVRSPLLPDKEKGNLASAVPAGPDGGLRGWIQVVAAFLLVLDGFGFITAFGVFQAYYVKLLPQSPSEISWIGSVQIFLLFLLGTISGRAIDAGHFRSTVLLGFVFQLGGVFGASFSSQYWQFLLSQGIATGIGNGLHFTALVWLVSQYFTKRRGLALGFSSCGAPIGAVVFTVIARELIPRVGIQWTLRVMGFIILANSIVIYLIARPTKATRKSGPFLERSAFSEPPYLFFCIGMFFAMLGIYFAYYYVPLFGRNELSLDDDGALLILIIMSAVGITGRLIPPFLADRFFKPLRTLVVFLLLSSLNVFAWTAVTSTAGLTAWVVAYAFTANAVQTLFTASMGEVTSDMTKLGVRIGMIFTIISFACLAGPPIGGRLVQYGNGDFVYAQIFAAASMLVGGLLVGYAKMRQVGWKSFWQGFWGTVL